MVHHRLVGPQRSDPGRPARGADQLLQAIQKLDEVYRTPFLMHFRGFKYHEIAEKLQIPIGTVKNRIHIARKLLKEDLMVYKHKN
jgi:RNA polymerase sigma-70 factor (ECF subfamily)